MHKKVSVIIPCFNQAQYLKQSVRSVLNQSYSNFEILIVNDGSTDDTEHVAKSFTDERIKYIYQKNLGLAGARNTGLKYACGEYLCFLDSDDLFYTHKLKKQVEFLEKNIDFGIVVSNYTRIDNNNNVFHISTNQEGEIPKEKIFHSSQFPVHTTLIRTTALKSKFYFDETLFAAEDWEFYSRLVNSEIKVYRIADILCAYRLTPGAMTLNIERQINYLSLAIDKIYANPNFPDEYKSDYDSVKINLYIKGMARACVLKEDAIASKYFKLVREKLKSDKKKMRFWNSFFSFLMHYDVLKGNLLILKAIAWVPRDIYLEVMINPLQYLFFVKKQINFLILKLFILPRKLQKIS